MSEGEGKGKRRAREAREDRTWEYRAHFDFLPCLRAATQAIIKLFVGSQVASDNNGMTGLRNSYPRELPAYEILLELVYHLYGTIGESFNISLSNNPAFLEGHFVRLEPLVSHRSAVGVQDGVVFERGPKICSFFKFYIDVFVAFVSVSRYFKLNSGKVGRNSRREATEGYSTFE